MSKARIGRLPPRYSFILNPYEGVRFSRCPKCERLTHLRKFVLLIWVEPSYAIALGKTCRFCSPCDLIIAHKDKLESVLTAMFEESNPDVIGNDYFVIGTVERKAWREGMQQPKSMDELLGHVANFKEVLTVEYQPPGWYPAEESS